MRTVLRFRLLLIIYIAKPMFCHSLQCYHCLFFCARRTNNNKFLKNCLIFEIIHKSITRPPEQKSTKYFRLCWLIGCNLVADCYVWSGPSTFFDATLILYSVCFPHIKLVSLPKYFLALQWVNERYFPLQL